MKKALSCINIPKHVCVHLLGENHSFGHRITVGVFIMFSGIFIAKIHTEYYMVHILCDATGYLFHGLGAVPLVEKLHHHINK